jgi:DNA adenine methylase
MKFYSPLRYPGGKNKLAHFIAKICIDNNVDGHYVEPFAGGASVALFLLFNNIISKITINDKDRSIYSFWYAVLNNSTELCRLIEKTDITIANWKIQRDIQRSKNNVDIIELAFSTLFLNRTNISGIIDGGVIGGLEQNGRYKINCRFNKEEIITRIREIAKKKKQIRLFNKDAIQLIDIISSESKDANSLYYFDPPYYLKGSSLYLNYYNEEDHQKLFDKISKIKKAKWIVSYDNTEFIQNIYLDYAIKEYSLSHTAHRPKIGQEILIFSKKLIININTTNPIRYRL